MSANSLGCREHPFGPGFDSRYFFVRPGHEESFRELLARVSARAGLILITGQSGTGKTTLLQELRAELRSAGAMTIFFPSPPPTAGTLLDSCLEQLGLHHARGEGPAKEPGDMADALRHSELARSAVLWSTKDMP